MNKLRGFESSVTPILESGLPKTTILSKNVLLIENFLKSSSVEEINNMMKDKSFYPVSVQGMQNIENAADIGSHRATMWNPVMAESLEKLFKNVDFPRLREFKNTDSTDWWQPNREYNKYEYYGISPMLRYMKYQNGGKHACHYDAGHIYKDNRYRTLMSMVMYLSTNTTGATRIIRDNQEKMNVWDRNHSDWSRDVENDEIIVKSYPKSGNVLIFDHRIPHDVEQFTATNNEERIIIRGDLIFKAI